MFGSRIATKKTTKKPNIFFTTPGGNDIKVSIKSLMVYKPTSALTPEIIVMFKQSIRKNFTLSFYPKTTDRKPVNTGNQYQVDIGSASNVKPPLYLLEVQQQTPRENPARSRNQLNNAIFDNVNVGKYLVVIDGIRYPRNPIDVKNPENIYLDHYKDLTLKTEKYVGESLLNPFMTHSDLKNFHLIQITDLRFQTYHIIPKKLQFFEKHYETPDYVNFYAVLMKHREIILVSDGKRLLQFNLSECSLDVWRFLKHFKI